MVALKGLPYFLFLSLLSIVVGSISAREAPSAEDLGAEIVYKHWRAEIEGNRLRLHVSERIVVYSPRGAEYGALIVSENSFAKFKDARMTVTDTSGGLIRELKKKHMTKACGFGGYELYSDVCTYWSDLDSPAFPYVVEYEYDIDYSSLFFWQGVNFQRSVPVREAVYELTVPSDMQFHYKAYGLSASPEISDHGEKKTYRWAATNLPALDLPDATPAWVEKYARLAFVADSFALGDFVLSGITWRSIGDWYRRMSADRYLPVEPGETRTEKKAALRSVYDEITDATRYVSVQIGVGGWQPYEAARTALRGYGDCKDLTTLLVSRLRQAGIESYPVLVRTSDLGYLDPDFPSLDFNHVISLAVVGADSIWMDPTCSTCDLGDLPFSDENIRVLVVTDSGGVLRRTPSATPEANVLEQVVSVDVSENAYCQITCSTSVTGDRARLLRSRLFTRSADERAAYLVDRFDLRANRCELQEWRVNGLEDRYTPLSIVVTVKSTRPLRRIGKSLYVSPFLFSQPSTQFRESLVDRGTPLKLDGIERQRDSVTIRWAQGLVIDSVVLPEDVSGDHETGQFRLHTSSTGNTATIVLDRVTTAYEVPPEAFATFTAYRDALVALSNQHVKLYAE